MRHLKKAVDKAIISQQPAHPKERAAFKSLLLANPNYFGNLEKSQYTAVLPFSLSTYYEELVCVGFHPQQQKLEAVVHVYQPSGYGTNICGPGTTEYVRFYLSYDNGATWTDAGLANQGLTGFQAYNVPEGTEGEKRLEYAVTLSCAPQRSFCWFERLILVRAILSWNNPPPANQPNWHPVWGNVVSSAIQVEPRHWIFLHELFAQTKLQLPQAILKTFDPETKIAAAPKALGAKELSVSYKDQGVPVHRFAFKELHSFVSGQLSLSAESIGGLLPGVAIDPGAVGALSPEANPDGNGDVSYEELTCIGLDPNFPDTLVGVIKVKKTLGYSGGLCTQGSQEYVTFWGDVDGNGTFETCFGTAQVTVHDLSHVPGGGVYYAVRLPIALEKYRQPCQKGPRLIPVRAILSWGVAPPCSNPNYVPVWGNREETLIQVPPHEMAPPGKIAILGGIPTGLIDGTTGLTKPNAVFALNNTPPDALGRPCPFAGRVSVQGVAVAGFTYIVEVSTDAVIWTPVLTDLIVTDSNGFPSTHKANPITKRFDYLPQADNIDGLLAEWDTAGDALWYVRLSIFDAGGVLQGTPDTHVLQLDNTSPVASIDILTGPGDCGKFPVGTQLQGKFIAQDLYFGDFSIGIEPSVNTPPIGVPSPDSGLVGSAPAPGDSWTLDTNQMQPCGYIIRVVVRDRAIVNSQSVGHYASDSAGFCLVEPTEG
jgi:hypothetical protein